MEDGKRKRRDLVRTGVYIEAILAARGFVCRLSLSILRRQKTISILGGDVPESGVVCKALNKVYQTIYD